MLACALALHATSARARLAYDANPLTCPDLQQRIEACLDACEKGTDCLNDPAAHEAVARVRSSPHTVTFNCHAIMNWSQHGSPTPPFTRDDCHNVRRGCDLTIDLSTLDWSSIMYPNSQSGCHLDFCASVIHEV